MRPADTQVLAMSNERSMSTSSARDQERSKRKASELISGREERDSTAVRVEHLNGHERHHENVAEGQHNKSRSSAASKGQMITGCVPCLMVGIPCNPNNPRCRLAMSTEWSVNDDEDNASESADQSLSPKSIGLNTLRLDTKWRRNWRERHSLNFFVAFSAPQMAGFFENAFWSQCIQYSYHEPVVLHAVSAIGSLHESILRGAFQNEKTKAQAIEFALTQCNRSIAYLTGTNNRPETDLNGFGGRKSLPVSKLALIACVLFTCFESMQGHCDSAVRHALQGRTLMEAHYAPIQNNVNNQEDDVELLRPLVERLEVQATALLDKRDRSATDETISVPPLPIVDRIYNLDHAHATLHSAMNSNMRYAQRSHPDAPADHHAITHAKMTMRYGPWYARWEVAFSAWLAENDGKLSNMDRKRAMVLKANQLVGTMIARVDQREGPAAYHPFDEEFRAIVDLSREVLSDFSCPPLPSLTASGAGTPYFSCSLWVTDPLWMAISRCRDPETRQAAFELLRQNPRQEGIWHTGPKTSSSLTRKAEKSPTSLEGEGSEGSPSSKEASSNSSPGSGTESVALGEVPEDVSHSEAGGNMRARAEWVDLMANSTPQSTSSDDVSG